MYSYAQLQQIEVIKLVGTRMIFNDTKSNKTHSISFCYNIIVGKSTASQLWFTRTCYLSYNESSNWTDGTYSIYSENELYAQLKENIIAEIG